MLTEQVVNELEQIASHLPDCYVACVVSIDGLIMGDWLRDIPEDPHEVAEGSMEAAMTAVILSLVERTVKEMDAGQPRLGLLKGSNATLLTVIMDEVVLTFGMHEMESPDQTLAILQQHRGDLLKLLNVEAREL